jgi:hypothetical protein
MGLVCLQKGLKVQIYQLYGLEALSSVALIPLQKTFCQAIPGRLKKGPISCGNASLSSGFAEIRQGCRRKSYSGNLSLSLN